MALTKINLGNMVTGTLPDANIPNDITIDVSSAVPASGLTGSTLASGVTASSLTSLSTALVANGSAGSPSHSFSANTDSGMYSPADNQLAFASGGTQALVFGGDQSATFASTVQGTSLYAQKGANGTQVLAHFLNTEQSNDACQIKVGSSTSNKNSLVVGFETVGDDNSGNYGYLVMNSVSGSAIKIDASNDVTFGGGDVTITSANNPSLFITSSEANTDNFRIYVGGTGLSFYNTTDSKAFHFKHDGDLSFGHDGATVNTKTWGNSEVTGTISTTGTNFTSTGQNYIFNSEYAMYFNVDSPGGTAERFVFGSGRTGTSGGSDWVTFTQGYAHFDFGGTNMAIATNTDAMHFLADTNNNGGVNPFEFWHNSATIDAGTNLFNITNDGYLQILGQLIYGGGDYGVRVYRSDLGIQNARFYDNGDYSFRGSLQSDKDKKKNIADIPDGSLALVNQLKPKTYKWKVSQNVGDATKTGFIAQDVAEVFGTNESVATGTDGNEDMGIDPTGIIAHLTKAVQELSAEVEKLKGN